MLQSDGGNCDRVPASYCPGPSDWNPGQSFEGQAGNTQGEEGGQGCSASEKSAGPDLDGGVALTERGGRGGP